VKDDADLPRLDRGPSRWPLYVRRSAIVAILAGYVVLIGALAEMVDWPDAYGFTCHRKCLGISLLESHRLLSGGTFPEVALFLLIWLAPVVLAFLFSPRVWTGPARDRIRPMESE
jgi:hypothetical protein